MNLFNRIVTLIPRKSFLYSFCKRYLDNYNGENNDNIFTNGELRFLRNNLGKCEVVFDVGANIGQWTKLALKINKKLKVHCFEPSMHSFEILKKNKFPTNVILNNFGLSSNKYRRFLYIFENGSGINSLYHRRGLELGWGLRTQQKKEEIQLDTLENYCRDHDICEIDFLKIDVEGHELEVIKGGKKLFEQSKVKIVQFEYGGCNIDARVFLRDFFDFFQEFDYNFYKIYPNFIKIIKYYDQRFENFQYQNWLIIKKNYKFT